MKKFTGNYTHTNHNFVVQNLDSERLVCPFLPAICILKNILQRGVPTLMSKYLQSELGAIHENDEFHLGAALISDEHPKWERIIRGDVKGNYNPAQKFFDELLPKHLNEYQFVIPLIVPEVPVNTITQVDVDEFANQQVDFYLPQAYLIIEIDGSQHDPASDAVRDAHTAKYGIETIRIKTTDLEAENDVFLKAMAGIRARIERVLDSETKRRIDNPSIIGLEEYNESYRETQGEVHAGHRATAVFRFQILILELLEKGTLSMESPWKLRIHNPDRIGFADLAIEDILRWMEHLLKLHKVEWSKPEYSISYVDELDVLTKKDDSISVSFSIFERYTDAFQLYPEVIFVRTDYFDEYLYFKKGNSTNKLEFSSFQPYDYFEVSTTEPIRYELKFGAKDTDEKSLLFLLENIFLQDVDGLEFNEGQLPIIANSLGRNDTIGLLPTGSGKSVCYQLSAILQPAVSFVVCPIKSLMYDQKADLDNCLFTRVNHITSDNDGEDKERIQTAFGKGKYFFIFISPERFQLRSFRTYFSKVNERFNIAYAVVDEVHCLSEWGHDFRTAYLNLSNTIKRYCTHFNFIGLTATASINVLKDIQVEFGIGQENVKTPLDYTRKELEFEVEEVGADKLSAIKSLIQKLQDEEDVLDPNGSESKCGIIFTPTVNGKRGCYPLSQQLTEHFQTDVKYYSGSVPKISKQPIMPDSQYDALKVQVQQEFKENQFTLLTATKAFGMGVNKPNIHYTVHYGIPNSMEALYQEGGRAGRDKVKFSEHKATCHVLLSKATTDPHVLDTIWNRATTLQKIKELQRSLSGDLNTNMFLFLGGLDLVKDEFEVVQRLLERYGSPRKKNVRVRGAEISSSKAKTEKAIYRLSQLQVIEDWTIENFFRGGEFDVDFTDYSSSSIRDALIHTIHKYEKEFSLDNLIQDPKYATYRKILNAPDGYSEIDKSVLVLLQWSYDNFAYNRRQSQKNIYENCCAFAEGRISKEGFKQELENYFKFNQASYVLQHIAEHPSDYQMWFQVFYKEVKNKRTSDLIELREREALRANLSRFLESYRYNAGLDFVSGMLRLWLDDFDNADGRPRLVSAFRTIHSYDHGDQEVIFEQMIIVASQFKKGNKDLLTSCVHEVFQDLGLLRRMHETLNDDYSIAVIVDDATSRLRTINQSLYGGFRKAG